MTNCDNCTKCNDLYNYPCSMCKENQVKDIKPELLKQLNIYFKSDGKVRKNAYMAIKSLCDTEDGKKAFQSIYDKADRSFRIKMEFQFVTLLTFEHDNKIVRFENFLKINRKI